MFRSDRQASSSSLELLDIPAAPQHGDSSQTPPPPQQQVTTRVPQSPLQPMVPVETKEMEFVQLKVVSGAPAAIVREGQKEEVMAGWWRSG